MFHEYLNWLQQNPLGALLLAVLLFLIIRKAVTGSRSRGFAMDSPQTRTFHSDGFRQDEDDRRFDGQTNGLRWHLSSISKVGGRHKGSSNQMHGKTVWKTEDVRTAESAFILIMDIGKEGIRIEKNPGDTLLGKLARKAGDMVLDTYVGGWFGDEYKSLVNLEGSETLEVQGLSDYFILTNTPEVAARCMSGDAVGILRRWRDAEQGFLRGEVAGNAGILLSESGCIVACQGPMSSEGEARRYADFCSSFAAAVKKGL